MLFDDNGISIDGPLSLSDSVDQVKRFEAAGWAATPHRRPRSGRRSRAAIDGGADNPTGRSLIACRTTIGFGAPTKAGTEKSPRLAARRRRDRRRPRKKLGWNAPPFEIPADIRDAWRAAGARGQPARARPGSSASPRSTPSKRAEFERRIARRAAGDKLAAAVRAREGEARRRRRRRSRPASASEFALEALTAALPEMIGGSADLTGSNNTRAEGHDGARRRATTPAASSITACASTAWRRP